MTTPGYAPGSRMAMVQRHLEAEDRQDLDAVMATFAASPEFHDHAWDEHHAGRNAVRGYYNSTLFGFSRLEGQIRDIFESERAVVLEATLSATHTGTWRGYVATNRSLAFPICAIFTFDDEGLITSERVYYDRTVVLEQLGVTSAPS